MGRVALQDLAEASGSGVRVVAGVQGVEARLHLAQRLRVRQPRAHRLGGAIVLGGLGQRQHFLPHRARFVQFPRGVERDSELIRSSVMRRVDLEHLAKLADGGDRVVAQVEGVETGFHQRLFARTFFAVAAPRGALVEVLKIVIVERHRAGPIPLRLRMSRKVSIPR